MEYWTIVNDRHAGPYTAEELMEMGITGDTPVWTSGLPDWVEASRIDELRIMLEQRDCAPAGFRPEPELPEPGGAPMGEEPAQCQAPAEPVEPEAPAQQQGDFSRQAGDFGQRVEDGRPVENGRPADGGYQAGYCDGPYQQPQQPYQQPQQPYEPQQPYQQPQQPQQPVWEWQQAPTTNGEPCPPAYLVWSIIVTLLCCMPLGVAAIIFSAQVKQAYNRGNLAKAEKMSEWAQWMIILSIVLGLITMPLQLAFSGI